TSWDHKFLTGISIYNQHLLEDPTKPLVVYLPPTGVHLSRYHSPIPSYLLSASTALARINYRWNIPVTAEKRHSSISFLDKNFLPEYHPFPFPIHDTLQAWTYITESFLPNLLLEKSPKLPEPKMNFVESCSSIQEIPSPTSKRTIIIYGDFLGATIAMSLALTESFEDYFGPTHEIRLIAKQGIYDWADIGTTLLTKDASEIIHIYGECNELGSLWDKFSLLRLRKRLFSGPNRCLDVFASPSLLFRQAGISAPSYWDSLKQPSSYFSPCFARDILQPYKTITDENSNIKKDNSQILSELLNTKDKLQEVQKLRMSHISLTMRPYLEFPSLSSQLRIPRTLLLYKDTPPLENSEKYDLINMKVPKLKLSNVTPMRQAENMACLMRHSVKIYSKTMRDPENTIQVKKLQGNFVEEEKIVKEWINNLS
ncbi:hypothetical protein EPUL_002014, partial [Erysiphe pulchra]